LEIIFHKLDRDIFPRFIPHVKERVNPKQIFNFDQPALHKNTKLSTQLMVSLSLSL